VGSVNEQQQTGSHTRHNLFAQGWVDALHRARDDTAVRNLLQPRDSVACRLSGRTAPPPSPPENGWLRNCASSTLVSIERLTLCCIEVLVGLPVSRRWNSKPGD
jgi:hypothetical protein